MMSQAVSMDQMVAVGQNSAVEPCLIPKSYIILVAAVWRIVSL